MPSQPNEQHYISVCMPFLKQFSFVTGCYNSSSIQQYISKSTNFSISSPALCQEYCLQKDIYKFAIQVCCKPTSVDMFFCYFTKFKVLGVGFFNQNIQLGFKWIFNLFLIC